MIYRPSLVGVQNYLRLSQAARPASLARQRHAQPGRGATEIAVFLISK